MKRLILAIFAASLFVSAHSWAQQPIELRFAMPGPPQALLNQWGYVEWVKDVNAASKGALNIRIMGGPSLATFDSVYDRVVKGVADIGFGVTASIGGQFSRTEVAALPFEFESPRDGSLALWRLLASGLIADEYSEVRPLGLFTFGQAAIHTRNAKIKSLADIKGMKLRAGGKIEGDMVAALGGAPITLNPAEIYQSLSNGLIEGAVVQWTAVLSFKLAEVAKNHFYAPLGSSAAFIVMNKRSYERLPAEAKAAIDKYSGEVFSRRMGEVIARMDDFAQVATKKLPGQIFETISPEEQARWKKQLEAIVNNWVKTTPNGTAVLAAFRSEIKKARAAR